MQGNDRAMAGQADSEPRIAVLGLGRMGAALASTLLKNHRSLMAWNRSAAKAAPLVDAGATLASSVGEAIEQAELIIICVGNYEHTNAMLAGTESLWRGKTLLQLSGGIAAEARALDGWIRLAGGTYLDGYILGFPDTIGSPEVSLMVTGNQAAWERYSALVRELGGGSFFLGEDVSSHFLLGAGFLLPSLFMFLGVIHGAYLSEQAGFPVAGYLNVLTSEGFFSNLRGESRRLGDAIVSDDFADAQAALETYVAALDKQLGDFDERGMSVDLVHAARALLRQAEAAGYGGEGLSALIKLLRQGATTDDLSA